MRRVVRYISIDGSIHRTAREAKRIDDGIRLERRVRKAIAEVEKRLLKVGIRKVTEDR